ncbi:hypothetical protein HZC33_02970 [Candidatus Wolfebacteria bacterium]|nr:hypothetical protein [Candidatus Wolfebacteria bacterium]
MKFGRLKNLFHTFSGISPRAVAIFAGIVFIMAVSFYFNLSIFQSFNKFLASAQTSGAPLYGYAWSSNIGWISFNCLNSSSCATSNYSVNLDADNNLIGYAWSSNIGWIKFDPVITNLGNSAPTNPQQGAKLNTSTNFIEGWARAVLPIASGGSAGGWDGWIKMSKAAADSGSSYGVQYDSINKKLTGYAWGGDVIGWISFSGTNYNVSLTIQQFSPPPPQPILKISPKISSMNVNSTQDFTANFDPDGTGPQLESPVSASWGKIGSNISLSASTGKTITVISRNEGQASITATYTIDGQIYTDTVYFNISLYCVCGCGGISCGISGGGGGGDYNGQIDVDNIESAVQAYISNNPGVEVYYQASNEKLEEYKSSPAAPSVCLALNYPNFFWSPLPAIYKDITFTATGDGSSRLWSFAPNAVPSSAMTNPATTRFASTASKIISLKAYDSRGNYCKRTKNLIVGGRIEQ